ncbi:centrosomal protein of 135 kDa-like isoform X2 [Entelurus aequoreus]|nr:centrosomal protein of 135 kDa-like isoform X2 [Entelurus aequoreus]XP_061894892.1 centrosomal protein of 135 kDa-like isoform X2 [Entelurus aequoreus]
MQANEAIPPPTCHLSPLTSTHPAASRPEDLFVANGRIFELQEEVSKIKTDLEKAHGCIKLLLTQVAERDKVIETLNQALRAGRPHDVVSVDAQNNTNKKVIAYLNLQIEYLQESNKMLEEKLSETQQKFSDKTADLSLKNFELCRDVAHKNNIVKQAQTDKKRGLCIAYRKLYASKELILDQQELIKDLEDNLIKIRTEPSAMNSSGFTGLDRIIDLEKAVQSLEKERLDLRSQLSMLRDSKRDVQSQMDVCSAARLQDEEAGKAAHSSRKLQGPPNSHELQLASMLKQLVDSEEEMAGLKQDKESVATKYRMLQDELTRQKQAAHGLEDVFLERDELKLRVSSYITTVSRIENLLKTKEQENFDLLERLRKARFDIHERDQRLQQVEDLMASVGMELRKVQPAAILSDLACARELNAKLDSDNELAVCQLTSKSVELELVKEQLEDIQSELLKKQLEKEKEKLTLLSNTLQKASEGESQMRFQPDRLIPADKMTGDCNYGKQVSHLQSRVSQHWTETNDCNTKVTSERQEQHVTFKD